MNSKISAQTILFFAVIDEEECLNANAIAWHMTQRTGKNNYDATWVLKKIQRVNENPEFYECCIFLKDTTSKHRYYRYYKGMPPISFGSPLLPAARDGAYKTLKGDVTHERRTISKLSFQRDTVADEKLKKALTRVIKKKTFLLEEMEEILERWVA